MELGQLLDKARRIAFFGGAGVSTESGIPDFRSSQGVYEAMRAFHRSPEYLLSHDCLMDEPEVFFEYYSRFLIHPNARPNAAHKALAYLEQQGKMSGIATQNIDGLHQAAGSRAVFELHGSIHRNHCLRCHKAYSLEEIMGQMPKVPRCACGGMIRPDVTLYGEMLDDHVLHQAVSCIRRADTLIIGGTSLAVWPAAGLVDYFNGDTLIVMNKSEISADARATLVVREGIAESFQKVFPTL